MTIIHINKIMKQSTKETYINLALIPLLAILSKLLLEANYCLGYIHSTPPQICYNIQYCFAIIFLYLAIRSTYLVLRKDSLKGEEK